MADVFCGAAEGWSAGLDTHGQNDEALQPRVPGTRTCPPPPAFSQLCQVCTECYYRLVLIFCKRFFFCFAVIFLIFSFFLLFGRSLSDWLLSLVSEICIIYSECTVRKVWDMFNSSFPGYMVVWGTVKYEGSFSACVNIGRLASQHTPALIVA